MKSHKRCENDVECVQSCCVQNRKGKTTPPSNANGYNCQRRKHRPPPDNRSRSTRHSPQGANPNTQLTLLSRYTSPDTSPDTSRHCVVSAPRHCGASAPTRQRPDTHSNSAPTPPRHCPTLRAIHSNTAGLNAVWNRRYVARRYAQRCRLCLCVRCGLDCALRPILRVLHAPR